jgi:hypothetical protein
MNLAELALLVVFFFALIFLFRPLQQSIEKRILNWNKKSKKFSHNGRVIEVDFDKNSNKDET